MGIADIKVDRKGRAEARTDFPGLGQGLAAGQSRWLLFAERSPALSSLQEHRPQLLHGYDFGSFVKAQCIC